MIRFAAILGLIAGPAFAQQLPSDVVVSPNQFVDALPETQLRFVYSNVQRRFHNEIALRDTAGLFPTTPPPEDLTFAEADLGVAVFEDWEEAVAFWRDLQVGPIVAQIQPLIGTENIVHRSFVNAPDGHFVLAYSFIAATPNIAIDHLCMARFVLDDIYRAGQGKIDLAVCTREQ